MALLAANPAARDATPIVALSAWRRRRRPQARRPICERPAGIARTSYIQVVLVILMVLAATAMARGLG